MNPFSEGFAGKLDGDSFYPVVFCRYELVTYEPGETVGSGTRTVTNFYWSEREIVYDGQTYETRIVKVTPLEQELDKSNQVFGEMGLQISNSPTNLAGSIQSGMKVTVYYGFEDSIGAGTVTNAEIIFTGVVSGDIEITEDSLSFEIIDIAHTYDHQIPPAITRRKFPLADPDSIGDAKPIVFGRVHNLECKPIHSGFASSLAEPVTAIKPAQYKNRFIDQNFIYIDDDPTWYLEFLLRKGIANVENPNDSDDVRQFVIGDDVNFGPHVLIGNSIQTAYSARVRAFEYDETKKLWKVILWPADPGVIDPNYNATPNGVILYNGSINPEEFFSLNDKLSMLARCDNNLIRWYKIKDNIRTIFKEERLEKTGDESSIILSNIDDFDASYEAESICSFGSQTRTTSFIQNSECGQVLFVKKEGTDELVIDGESGVEIYPRDLVYGCSNGKWYWTWFLVDSGSTSIAQLNSSNAISYDSTLPYYTDTTSSSVEITGDMAGKSVRLIGSTIPLAYTQDGKFEQDQIVIDLVSSEIKEHVYRSELPVSFDVQDVWVAWQLGITADPITVFVGNVPSIRINISSSNYMGVKITGAFEYEITPQTIESFGYWTRRFGTGGDLPLARVSDSETISVEILAGSFDFGVIISTPFS